MHATHSCPALQVQVHLNLEVTSLGLKGTALILFEMHNLPAHKSATLPPNIDHSWTQQDRNSSPCCLSPQPPRSCAKPQSNGLSRFQVSDLWWDLSQSALHHTVHLTGLAPSITKPFPFVAFHCFPMKDQHAPTIKQGFMAKAGGFPPSLGSC